MTVADSKKEIINQQISHRGLTLIDEPATYRSSSRFQCSYGHEWKNSPSNILGGQGCGVCAISKRAKTRTLSRDAVAERIEHTGIKIIGEYINTKIKTLFRCRNNHEWSTTPNNILRGQRCPFCCGQFKRTKAMINEQLSSRQLELIGEYVHTHHKSLFRCSHGHQWMATPRSVVRGNGCPSCATHGYDPLKSAHVYLIDFGTFIKYGITTDLHTRLKAHESTAGKHKLLIAKFYESGSSAVECENEIKKQFGGNFVSRTEMMNGWTETLSPLLTEEVHRFIKNY